MKKEIITLTGDLSSGKTTVSNILIDKLNYQVYRNGEYFRKLAKEHNMDVTSFNKYVESNPNIDKQIELNAKNYAIDHDKLIVDARLGWYSIPESFKVYLTIDIDVASKRAYNDEKRKSTEYFSSEKDHKNDLIKRRLLERDRYLNLYSVDIMDMANYDIVIDTTNKTPEEVSNIIIKEYNDWLKK